MQMKQLYFVESRCDYIYTPPDNTLDTIETKTDATTAYGISSAGPIGLSESTILMGIRCNAMEYEAVS